MQVPGAVAVWAMGDAAEETQKRSMMRSQRSHSVGTPEPYKVADRELIM